MVDCLSLWDHLLNFLLTDMISSFQMMGPFWCCQRLSQKHSVTNRSADMTLRAASDFSALDVAAWRDQWNTEKNCPSMEGMTQCKGHCKMFFWSLELSSLISGQWWRGKNCTRNLPPPLLKSPWHRENKFAGWNGLFFKGPGPGCIASFKGRSQRNNDSRCGFCSHGSGTMLHPYILRLEL